MGGTLELTCLDPVANQLAILLSVPMPIHAQKSIVIRVEVASHALSALCKSYLGDNHVRFHEGDDPSVPDLVVIEAGTEGDQRALDVRPRA